MAEKSQERGGSIDIKMQPKMRCMLSAGCEGKTSFLPKVKQRKTRKLSAAISIATIPA
jgi:hypothetical protein